MHTIGEAAAATGLKVPTIRFYQDAGLIPAPIRTASGRRMYDDALIDRLKFIRHARQLGFELDQVRTLLSLTGQPDSSCETIDAIATGQLEAVRSRIERLRALEAELVRVVDGCRGGVVSACRVVEALKDHSCCASDHEAVNSTY